MKKKFLSLILAISMIPAPIASYAANNIENASAINETISNSSVFNSSFIINKSDLVKDLNRTKNKNITQFLSTLMSIITAKSHLDLEDTNKNGSFVNETILNNSVDALSSVNETDFANFEENITEENITELLTLLDSYKNNFSVLKILKPYIYATGAIGSAWFLLHFGSKLVYNFLYNIFIDFDRSFGVRIGLTRPKKLFPWCVRKTLKNFKKRENFECM